MTGIKAFFTVLLIMPLGHAVTVLAARNGLRLPLCHADGHRSVELHRKLVKWKVFSEPWITLNPVFLAISVAAFIGVLAAIKYSAKAAD